MSSRALWPSGERVGAAPVLRCEDAREAVSATLDNEGSPFPDAALAQHLAQCQPCQLFGQELQSLARPPSVRSPKPVPPGLARDLLPLLSPRPRPRLLGRPQWSGRAGVYPVARPTPPLRWLATALPALALVAAVSTGAASSPKLVPARPKSACTIGLPQHAQNVQRTEPGHRP